MAQPRRVAVLSLPDDLHALMIQDQLITHGVDCSIVETSRLFKGGANWINYDDDTEDLPGNCFTLPANNGELLDVRQLDLVWFRRINYPQEIPELELEPMQLEIVNNEYKATMFGLLATAFTGTWVNDPFASYGSENKLIQLTSAKRAGFRTPATLVSHDPSQIRKFCESYNFEVIVKTVKGSARRPLYTVKATQELVAAEDSIRLAPAMYQEYIPGYRHIRAHCFGKRIYSFEIESEALDWRGNLNVPIRPIQLEGEVEAKLHSVLRQLGLRMGIVDLKRLPTGECVWLEVNPQGQFLFLEGLTGERLGSAFTEFLLSELDA